MPRGVSPHGMTMAFLTMSMCEIFHSFNMRSQRKSVFSLPFGFTPVSWTEYGIALALAVLVIPIVELVKLIQRRLGK